jgi:hypothetical protein
MNLINNNGTEVKSKFVGFRQFKDWYCSVNWFFLHIEQQTDSVYHHQTCQAKLDGTRGSIGKLSQGEKIIENLKQKISQKNVPIIVCPNNSCGCGLCTPKSKSFDKLINTLNNTLETTDIFSKNIL